MSKKQGFASLEPEKHREVSARGGQKTGVSKGFASLTPEERSQNASRASQERWRRVREERQRKHVENSSKEDASSIGNS